MSASSRRSRRCRTALLLLFASSAIGAESPPLINVCPGGKPERVQNVAASAAYLANALGRPHSIKAQSARLLQSALAQAQSTPNTTWVEFTSIPEPAADDPNDHPACRSLFEQTREQPLRYAVQRLSGQASINAWIAEFTQGQGVEGQKLYRECPGRCSPQYHWWIRNMGDGYQLHSAVVCGLPRDRQSDRYQLTTTLWRDCQPATHEGVAPQTGD